MAKRGGNAKPHLEPIFPLMLETSGFEDYRLLDSGDGSKLERYGRYTIIRPEPQAMWQKRLPDDWQSADAVFTGAKDEESDGRWKLGTATGKDWSMQYGDIRFIGRFTSFRHLGVFPEQAPHWDWTEQRIASSARPVRLLNLFGYTGILSLIAAGAGAIVTHVDGSKKSIAWARDNQTASGLADAPIRWICDDAMKFVKREARRQNRYDAIVLDPPKFGRGPKGEVWEIFTDLAEMVRLCRGLLSDDASFLVLTAYSIRASFVSIHELMADSLVGLGGRLESGELLLREQSGGRALSTSLFSRWSAP